MRSKVILSALVLLFALDGRSAAAIMYSYVTDAPVYYGNTGTTVTVNVFLKETLTGGSTSLIASEHGLFSAGAGVNVVAPFATESQVVRNGFLFNGAPEPNGFTGATSVAYNQGTGLAANNLEFLEAVNPTAGSGDTANTNGLFFLGDLKITVGKGRTTFALTSLNNDTINGSNSQLGQTDGNTLTFLHNFDLDAGPPPGPSFGGADSAPAFNFVVQALPEPTSLLVFGTACASGAALGAWRRWRNRVALEG